MSRPKKPRRSKGGLADTLAAFLKKTLLPDLKDRATAPQVRAALSARFQAERLAHLTADAFDHWIEHLLEQVAAAWILSCVFVRTLEDRALLGQRRLAGPGARDSMSLFFELFPALNEADYLRAVFRELGRLPGGDSVLSPARNPAWQLGPSAEVARALVEILQELGEGSDLRLTFGGSDSRFLGDLYEKLSESVQERLALRQTPPFVERLILDLTLEPAIATFGLEQVRVLDPTCGSGHFLLSAFERIFEHRLRTAPGVDRKAHAVAALQQVYGVDINPYAVSIARFRLTLAFLEKAGITKLRNAPPVPLNLVVADTLAYGGKDVHAHFAEIADDPGAWARELFDLEERPEANRLFCQRYHVVVGNPPYIQGMDKALKARREIYRKLYASAKGKFALAAPFVERFFQLACDGGYVGMINSNACMKRDYGKPLIEKVLPLLDVTRIVDTSGAYIPGHGTPTFLLFGRNQKPVREKVRTVLGRRGEPFEPADGAEGKVWRSIVAHHDEPGFEDDFVTVADVLRTKLAAHPWSLAGGGAMELREKLEASKSGTLAEQVDCVGFGAILGEDDAFGAPRDTPRLRFLPLLHRRPLVEGELVRDWCLDWQTEVFFPYSAELELVTDPAVLRWLWTLRARLWARPDFSKRSYKDVGRPYWEYHQIPVERNKIAKSITFAFVATHNHFVVDQGGKVFNRSAPIIKLSEGSTEEDHLRLVAFLNSSTAAFWFRQVLFSKGAGKMGDGARVTANAWEDYLEFAGTPLEKTPLPAGLEAVEDYARLCTAKAAEAAACLPARVIADATADIAAKLAAARARHDALRGQLVALQEELDWAVYKLFGLHDGEVLSPDDAAAHEVPANLRPFEVNLARLVARGIENDLWFTRHGRRPVATYAGAPLAPRLAALYEQRLEAIGKSRDLQLLEQHVHKRRWPPVDWEVDTKTAAEARLLSEVEKLFEASTEPRVLTVRAVAAALHASPLVAELLEILSGAADADLASVLGRLVHEDAVPYLAAYRFTDAALAGKRRAWEETWELQRREDAGEEVKVAPPPRYARADYRDPRYSDLRGELDVPKERFISYPGAEGDDDTSAVYGWAGWNHVDRARALAALYQERKDGWDLARRIPVLAGLWELVPWLKQWHDEPSAEFHGERLGTSFDAFVKGEAHAARLSVADLEGWRPPAAGRKKKKEKKPAAEGRARGGRRRERIVTP